MSLLASHPNCMKTRSRRRRLVCYITQRVTLDFFCRGRTAENFRRIFYTHECRQAGRQAGSVYAPRNARTFSWRLLASFYPRPIIQRSVICFQVHIQAMIDMDSVRLRWKEKKGRLPTSDDAERIYQKSLSATLEVLPNNSHVIKGILILKMQWRGRMVGFFNEPRRSRRLRYIVSRFASQLSAHCVRAPKPISEPASTNSGLP